MGKKEKKRGFGFGRRRKAGGSSSETGGAVPTPGSLNCSFFDTDSAELPLLVTKCIECLDEKHLELEGIFRVPGSVGDIQRLTAAFESGQNPSLSEYDGHAIGGCLKKFLRDLPDPVCTFELYDCFLAAGSVPFRASRVSCVQKVLELLPPGNYALLRRFCKLLFDIAAHSSTNKMRPSNLAIVFAPTLLRAQQETLDEMFGDATQTNFLVERFVVDYEEIFEDKPVVEEGSTGTAAAATTTTATTTTIAAKPSRRSLTHTEGKLIGKDLQATVAKDGQNTNDAQSGQNAPISLVTPAAVSPATVSIPSPVTTLAGIPAPLLGTRPPAQTAPASSLPPMIQPRSFTAIPTSPATAAAPPSTSQPGESFKAKALWDFDAELPDEISFKAGAIISVMPNKQDKRGFWYGSVNGQTGWFQNDFVEKIDVYYEAIHPYTADPTKTHLLTFAKGDIVLAIKDGDEGGWWQGELNGKTGLFYRPYFRKVCNSSSKTAPAASASSSATTTGATSTAARGSHAPLLKADSAQRNFYRMMSFVNLDKVAASALTAGGMAGSPKVTGELAAAADARATSSAKVTEQDDDDDDDDDENEKDDVEWVRAAHNYTAKPNTPELNLQKGDLLRVVQRFGSGWMEVEKQDGSVGYAPGTFVEACTLPKVPQ